MSAPEDKQPDQARIVALLAEESQLPVDDVAKLYERERAELAAGAHITQFLHVFAIRNVQDILRKRAIERTALQAAGRPLLLAKRLPLPLPPARSMTPAIVDKPNSP